MAAMNEATNHGLRLTLGGAPATPHVVADVPGMYWPHLATPVGGDGDPVNLDDARRYSNDPAYPLELVSLTDAEAADGRERFHAAIREAMTGIAQARRDPEGHEADFISDQINAVKTAAVEHHDEPAVIAEEDEQ